LRFRTVEDQLNKLGTLAYAFLPVGTGKPADAAVRLWSRRGTDFTARLPVIAATAARIGTASFTIDGDAVVRGPDGLSAAPSARSVDNGPLIILVQTTRLRRDAMMPNDRMR